jgi:Protein of unknown function (DUF3224)
MATYAKGSFEVKLTPYPAVQDAEAAPVGRLSIAKQFQGDLEATSRGEMLAAGTSVKGSAGYVAIEQVAGSLGGRTGTFVLQHNGTMSRGTPTLSVSVVPDSGTGELEGLQGQMAITIDRGEHSYELEYTLPDE